MVTIHARTTRWRRRVGLTLLLAPLAMAAVLMGIAPFGRIEAYWIAYHYLWVPGPYAMALGALLLLPDSFRREERPATWGFWSGVSWLVLIGLAVATGYYQYLFHRHDSELMRLEDPGRFEAAILEAHGKAQIDSTVWARSAGGGRYEIVASPDYPPCHWPIEIRRSGVGARYLAVDSRGWAVALYDLNDRNDEQVARVFEDLPPLTDLRQEFGADLVRVSTHEAQIEYEESRQPD